jgi:iron-sulfur cluster repair protein YtfE (RIC family)
MNQYKTITREHGKLSNRLSALLRVLAERQRKSVEVALDLEHLKDELLQHFHDEEEGGFFEGIVERAPRFSERIALLREEHERLLEHLRQLQTKADITTATPDWWEDVARSFRDFSCDLMRHEHRENTILQEAYGVDIGGQE